MRIPRRRNVEEVPTDTRSGIAIVLENDQAVDFSFIGEGVTSDRRCQFPLSSRFTPSTSDCRGAICDSLIYTSEETEPNQ